MNKKFKFLVIFCVITSIYIFYTNKLKKYNIEHVQIFGCIATSEQKIHNIVKKNNMHTLSSSRIQKQIVAMPWVKHCIIKKTWPDKIVILIEEHIPSFMIQKNKETYFVNYNGQILGKQYPIDRIMFDGQIIPHETQNLMQLLAKYPTLIVTKIKRLRSNRFDLITQRHIIKCGDNNIEKCIIRYLTLPQKFKNTNYTYIDLRHPHRTVFYN